MKVVVTGGRDFQDRDFVFQTLDSIIDVESLAVGDASGADQLAAEWASLRGIPCKVFKADWETNGRAAGPIRNGLMLDTVRPDLVVAFPGGRGTADCVRQARAKGFEVLEVKP